MAAFQVIRSEWRQSVRSELAKVSENNLVRFVFSKNDWTLSENEFKHEGKYYDVVSTTTKGDSIEVFCFDDATETRLTTEFSNLIIKNTAQNTDYQHKTAFSFQLLIKDFYFPMENMGKYTPSVFEPILTIFSYKNRFSSSNFLSTDTPPPNVQVTLVA
jgi:hypothetical protein